MTHGSPALEDPAVGALVYQGEAYCTGSLIAPRWVLTAAHCVLEERSAEFVLGADPGGESSTAYDVLEQRVHPDYRRYSAERDVALLLLAEPSPVVPLPLASALSVESGELARVVGYGATSVFDDSSSQKRQGVVSLAELALDTLTLVPQPSQPCGGDSGGPVLLGGADGEQIVGVISSGDISCEREAIAARVDAIGDFVSSTVAEMASCDSEQSCRPVSLAQCSTLPSRPGPSWQGTLMALGLFGLRRGRALRTRPPR
ncbi:MAG TPA: trypsin-like serine protease [Polyangiaceae bacterium]|nr:trypsin-like serine protease [Polyangiaceae bacterium]